jgi:hemolysin activation/secretion protein
MVFGRSIPVNPLLYAFTDLGRAWQNQRDEAAGQVASFGVGARFNLAPGAEFLVEGVRRLELNPNDSQTELGRVDAYGGYWRLLIRL